MPVASGARWPVAIARRYITCKASWKRSLQPFLTTALTDLRDRGQPLVLDADLTGCPVSATSRTYPGAAFGYMDGMVHLGYQLAELCQYTAQFGRQWLSGMRHPGDMVA